VKEAVQKLSLLCDPQSSFSCFTVSLKNDYGKTGILNTEPDQRRTDAPLLCHIIQGQAYWSLECHALLNVQGRWTHDKDEGAARSFATCETSHHI